MSGNKPLGLAGTLTRAFISSPLTPLLLIAALLGPPGRGFAAARGRAADQRAAGRHHGRANGHKADEAVKLVTRPLENIVKGINGVEHVYSQTQDDQVVVTARFLVGTDEDAAVLRVHEKIRAELDRIPKGIPEPLIVGRGVNDVAIVVLTLVGETGKADDVERQRPLSGRREASHEIAKVEGVGETYVVGGSPSDIRVEPDPEKPRPLASRRAGDRQGSERQPRFPRRRFATTAAP